ncbi:indole-3-glycerol phosphate synthase TrpC [Companilactobacillus furfuricola]|uniref:indole-3-glycerol phosphate synthase TrpC n=1 Tax=Companilactobacillus furfuricola TaxID=1462575 RepID=UPI000F799EB0|nr:indole-3-glycerol phosphate synthase TrpC [Companilactobacillus furfuricola]
MILDDLVKATQKRIEQGKQIISPTEMEQQASKIPNKDPNDIIQLFLQPRLHFIAEIKRSSPSKGTIVKDFPYLEIAQQYQQAHIDAISVLTEPDFFHGDIRYLKAISQKVPTPLLRKDFTIDPYMIYQAKANGASLILLIVAILTDKQLKEYLQLAKQLGLAALVEVHDEQELAQALTAGAEIIGVNNRNLKDFTVDINNSLKLRPLVDRTIPFITESGIKDVNDIARLKQAHVNGVLIGETFMKAPNRIEKIQQFQGV